MYGCRHIDIWRHCLVYDNRRRNIRTTGMKYATYNTELTLKSRNWRHHSGFTYAPKGPRADSFISIIFLAMSVWPVSSRRGGCSKRASTTKGNTSFDKRNFRSWRVSPVPQKVQTSRLKIELAFIKELLGPIWNRGCFHWTFISVGEKKSHKG